MPRKPKASIVVEVEAPSGKALIRKLANRQGNPNPPTDHLTPYKWKPGQSGNPNGRPSSTTEMKQRAASLTHLAVDVKELHAEGGRLLLERAIGFLSNPKSTLDEMQWAQSVLTSRIGMEAAEAILSRGHGKPQQKVEIDSGSVLDDMDEDEKLAYLKKLEADVADGYRAEIEKAKK
jgi:hypothetical protein